MNYLALDIGGTNTKYAIISNDGKLLKKQEVKTPTSYEYLLDFIITTFHNENVNSKFIGLSCPGIYDPTLNQITGSSALSYLIDKDIVGDIKGVLPTVDVLIENDGNCALLGEVWKGHAQNVSDAAIIVVGSAIGGGAFVNGQLLRGAFLNAGEFGYMMIDNNVENQSYHSFGGKGGLNGLIRLAQKQGYPVTNGLELFQEMEGNPEIRLFVEQQLLYTAIGIINIQYVLDPSIIIIGGAISKNEKYIELLNKALEKIMLQRPLYKVRPHIMPAKNSNDANLL
ncbi:ROK family protein [Bacillus sp. JJ722]|uniref:ROK family protein n=1 Tax=Bacillus sp. JJ722 TaxID=3122973 RepID=UPI0030008394